MSGIAWQGREAKSQASHRPPGSFGFEPLAILYLRVALGASFLSGIADRLGLYTGRNVGYGNFAGFLAYAAKVNSFMPASSIAFLAWTATAAELLFGVALVLGIWLRWAALGSSVLLLLFASDMAISVGIKSPLDRSVFSASAGALLLSMYQFRKIKELSANARGQNIHGCGPV
jgi:putative oxidoreductase